MKDTANKAYGAWPDRIFVVDKKGKITYRGGMGPRGFRPDELLEYLDKEYPDVKKEEDKR